MDLPKGAAHAEPSRPEETRDSTKSSQSCKRYLWVALGFCTAAAAAVAAIYYPLIWFALTVFLIATATKGRKSLIAALPVSVMLLCAYLMLVGILCGATHVDLYNNAATCRAVMIVATATAIGCVWLRRRRTSREIVSGPQAVALVPTALLVVIGFRYTLALPSSWASLVYDTHDPIAHMLSTAFMFHSGNYTYPFDLEGAYPRGLYAVVAPLAGATGEQAPERLLPYFLNMVPTLAWVLFVCAVMAAALLVLKVGLRYHANKWLSAALAALGTLALCYWQFSFYLFYSGYYTAIMCLAALCVFLVELQNAKTVTSRSLIVSATCVFVAANSWQLSGVVLALLLIPVLVGATRTWKRPISWGLRLTLCGVAALLAVSIAPYVSLLATFGSKAGTGFGITTELELPAVYLALAGALTTALIGLAVRPRSLPTTLMGISGWVFVAGAAILVVRGQSFSDYYPDKTLRLGLWAAIPAAFAAVAVATTAKPSRHAFAWIRRTPVVRFAAPAAAVLASVVLMGFFSSTSILSAINGEPSTVSVELTEHLDDGAAAKIDAVYNIAGRVEYSPDITQRKMQISSDNTADQYEAMLLSYYRIMAGVSLQEGDTNLDRNLDVPTALKAAPESASCRALQQLTHVVVSYTPVRDVNPNEFNCVKTLRNVTWVDRETGERTSVAKH